MSQKPFSTAFFLETFFIDFLIPFNSFQAIYWVFNLLSFVLGVFETILFRGLFYIIKISRFFYHVFRNTGASLNFCFLFFSEEKGLYVLYSLTLWSI